MLDGLKRSLAGAAIASVLKSLATNTDTKTTITGILAAAMLAIPGLDWSKVVAGDPVQIAHLGAGLLVALLGYLATKPGHDGHTTFAGVAAGSLYAAQGSIEAITTGLIVAVLGYFTNKPVTEGREVCRKSAQPSCEK